VLVAHKVALDPNNKQRSYFARASGAARFAYNWALGEWQRQYREGGKPSAISLCAQLNKLKHQQLDVRRHQMRRAGSNSRPWHGVPSVF
jgi:putative transposase